MCGDVIRVAIDNNAKGKRVSAGLLGCLLFNSIDTQTTVDGL